MYNKTGEGGGHMVGLFFLILHHQGARGTGGGPSGACINVAGRMAQVEWRRLNGAGRMVQVEWRRCEKMLGTCAATKM